MIFDLDRTPNVSKGLSKLFDDKSSKRGFKNLRFIDEGEEFWIADRFILSKIMNPTFTGANKGLLRSLTNPFHKIIEFFVGDMLSSIRMDGLDEIV